MSPPDPTTRATVIKGAAAPATVPVVTTAAMTAKAATPTAAATAAPTIRDIGPAGAAGDADADARSAQARRRWSRQIATLGLLAGAATILFGSFWLLDFYVTGSWVGARGRTGPLDLLLAFDISTLQNALAGLSQVIVAVLGIAITVVSIIVQLSATRYSSRIAALFFRDRSNLTIMGFFVVACINAVWVSVAFTSHYVPRATVGLTLALVTGSLLLLIPYFAHVFDFLDPEKIIARIGQKTLDAALGRGSTARIRPAGRQAIATASMEHLADIAVNALAQKDKVIASGAVAALRRLLVSYLGGKSDLSPAWFRLAPKIRDSPDFIALAGDSLAELERQRVWLEWKGLRHLWTAFLEALKHLPEMAHVVAIETRYIGEAALAMGDDAVVGVTLKFFNTYLRAALNARDVRAAYNILNQYRQLGERVLRTGRGALSIEIARHLKYYGQTAHGLGLGFVTETAAHDLSALCERAFEQNSPAHDDLLRVFLEVDKEAETDAEEKALRGVRKAQVKLATYYLLHGAPTHAHTIAQDMQHESPVRLASLHAELDAVSTKDFWEVSDRGVNFDYLDGPRKQQLAPFFAGIRR